ncbi:unnamed protein product [Orchesella dallaii]|uniref:Uncharacterized protein n=1 Tax=Orchesella dallaii TaxID=48710 RepID=A0ABP1RG73_9HEXA
MKGNKLKNRAINMLIPLFSLVFISFSENLLVTATELSSSGAATTSIQHENVQRTYKGDGDAVVAVKIPDGSNFRDFYPRTKNVKDSREFHEESDRIAANGTMISGVSARFRSGRAYPMELPDRYSRYRRYYTNRNSIDSEGSSWSGKWFNNLRRRTSSIMSPASAYDNQGYQTQQQEGMLMGEEPEMAATFLGGGHGGGYGGSGGGGGYGKGVNKSAVGLLGFLSLLSLIQNVLNQTNMAGGRKRRDVNGMDEFDANYDWQDGVTETVVLSPLALPILNAVAHAENGVIPAECTLQPICLANHFLVENLGERGKSLGMTLSTVSSKMITRKKKCRASGWDIAGRVIRAGMAGRSGKDCKSIYKECPEVSQPPKYSTS